VTVLINNGKMEKWKINGKSMENQWKINGKNFFFLTGIALQVKFPI
jgi:hypothetical protein